MSDTPTPTPPSQPAEPAPVAPPAKPRPQRKPAPERIAAILAEGYAQIPVLISPVSGTPVPVADFLQEYLVGGWRLEVLIREQRRQ